MNKAAIQKYAIWARKEMIAQVSQRAYQYGITAEGYGEENAVTVNGRVLSSDEQAQRLGLVTQIRQKGFLQVMEEVAYTWFNRFIALRFMEVNNYLPAHVRVFTDSEGAFKPEILTEALHLEMPGLDREKVAGFIDKNQTDDLYRYLLLIQCNALNEALPRMFERMGSYTELLLPNNILRPDGILGQMITDIPEEDWTDQVQIIGWLYQYYISEAKDETFALLKKNVKVTKERIPSATQLFTPDWIVRYMVENSLGRLWIEGHPDKELRAGWKYYLDETEQEPQVEEQLAAIRVEYSKLKPQDIKFIDPCMGSGHILVYAFDVLVQIYKQTGVSEREAAQSILQNNLYGLDVDDRAAQLAYFAVMMKARQYDRRILTRGIQPQLYSTACFPEGEEYGSLLISDDPGEVPEIGQTTLRDDELRVRHLLSQKYDVVFTNPPYMGAGNMNPLLSKYVKKYYPDAKADLFSAFMERAYRLAKTVGFTALITMESWMFLSSFEKLRIKINTGKTITNMVHMPYLGKGRTSLGINFGTAAVVTRNCYIKDYSAQYEYTVYYETDENGVPFVFPTINERWKTTKQSNFSKIPGSPVVYWLSGTFLNLMCQEETIGKKFEVGSGLSTSDNERFLRFFWEVNVEKISDGTTPMKWFLFQKGGEYRRWYGNLYYVVNWENDGEEIKYWVTHNPSDPNTTSWSRRIFNTHLYFQTGITWSVISSSKISFRTTENNSMISNAAGGIFGFSSVEERDILLAALNTKLWTKIFSILNPTLNYSSGVIQKAPLPIFPDTDLGRKCVSLSKADWDSFETSWDFQFHPMVPVCADDPDYAYLVSDFYNAWKERCQDRFDKLKANEEELNRIFINIYGLQDELTPEVEDKDVTVRLADLGRDVRSLISYAVGCMFGRYSANGPVGLIYAGGEWDPDRYGRFKPDADNIIPICDDEYFDDDIVGRFVQWLEVVFGKRSLEDNLNFIADALGGKGSPREVIRSYFLNDFYADHLKIYQKRPIYWLFDSGKKNGFKALVYMHRYQSDLLARMRTDYVHEQQERYRTQLRHIEDAMSDASTSERVKLSKQQAKLREQALELQKYEEKIHHIADQNIQIDLDDGVKHNYALFADVLAKIK